jgi:hypothetical protein
VTDRVRGVKTKQGRDITAIVNRSSRPVAFLTMLFGENSGLDEASRRNNSAISPCDVSGNLPHISICRAVEAGLVPAGSLTAFWAWMADTPVVLDTAREWFETQIRWAEGTLGRNDPRVELLAACWWNAPNAGAVDEARRYGEADRRTREASAAFWLSDNLAQLSPKYAANKANYVRGRGQAEQYRVEEEPSVATTLIMPVREEFADTPEGLAEYQKSLLEFAVACDLAGDAEAGVAAMKTLNNERYKDLVARPK